MRRMILAGSAALVLMTGAAVAQTVAEQVVAGLEAQGFSQFEVRTEGAQVVIGAIRGGTRVELIYDPRTGELLGQETSRVVADAVLPARGEPRTGRGATGSRGRAQAVDAPEDGADVPEDGGAGTTGGDETVPSGGEDGLDIPAAGSDGDSDVGDGGAEDSPEDGGPDGSEEPVTGDDDSDEGDPEDGVPDDGDDPASGDDGSDQDGGSEPEDEGDADRGHGNDADGFDEDNPGRGNDGGARGHGREGSSGNGGRDQAHNGDDD